MPKKWGEYQSGGSVPPVFGESGIRGAPNASPNGAVRSHQPEDQLEGQPGSSFAARFGRVILRHGIAAIPSALYHYQGKLGLSAQQVWFISYILSHKWDADLPYPSLHNMARCTAMTYRNLLRIKDGLCKRGYLKVYPRYAEGKGRDTNFYDFADLFNRLEELITADPPAPNAIRTEEAAPTLDASELARLDSSFVARFGRVVAKRGVAAVPRAIFTHQKALALSPQQVWFVTYIFSFQWDAALPYPSIEKMVVATGYSRAHLHTIKSELVKAAYLRLVHRTRSHGGQDTNAYDFSGLFDAIRACLQQTSEPNPKQIVSDIITQGNQQVDELPIPRRGRAAAQSNASRAYAQKSKPSDAQHTGPSDAQQTGPSDIQPSGGRDIQQTGGGDSQQTWPGDAELVSPIYRSSPGEVTPGRRGIVTLSGHESESKQKETNNNKGDSNHLSHRRNAIRNGIRSTFPSSIYIVAVMDDFSNELNDLAHKPSNVTQALHLWQASGLSEQEFIQLVYEAKQITRNYQGKNGLRGIENKMAYFFAVLRDLCGLRSATCDTDVQTSAVGPIQEDQSAQYTGSTPPGRDGIPMVNAKQLWQATLTELQVTVPAASFQTWLKNTSIAAFETDRVVITVPSNFAKEWLEKRYSRQIAETLNNVLGYKVQMCFEVKTPGATR